MDDKDLVWLSDFGSNALVRFDPSQQKYVFSLPSPGANVRQLLEGPVKSGEPNLGLINSY